VSGESEILGSDPLPISLEPPAGARVLLFDCDGTLVDTLGLYKECWREVFAKRGFELTDEWYAKYNGHSMEYYLRGAFPNADAAELAQLEHEGLELFFQRAHELEPLEHVVEIARKYHGTMPMAVVSGGPRSAVERTIDAVNIRHLFDMVITLDDVENGKPEPDVYLLAMERMGVSAADCVAYEDSNSGMTAARAAGIPHVLDVNHA